jgi:hypothetical protein
MSLIYQVRHRRDPTEADGQKGTQGHELTDHRAHAGVYGQPCRPLHQGLPQRVLKKLTFPEEKKLRLEIIEDQISGRVSYLDINYRDILNADSFAPELLINLQ